MCGTGLTLSPCQPWTVKCNSLGVRIALKPVTDSTTTVPITGLKSSGTSFLDMLSQVSGEAVRALSALRSGTQGQSSSPGGNADQNADAQSSLAQPQASGTTQADSTSVQTAAASSATAAQSAAPTTNEIQGQSSADSVTTKPLPVLSRLVFGSSQSTPTSTSQPATTSRRVDRSTPQGQVKPLQPAKDQTGINLEAASIQASPALPLVSQQVGSENPQIDSSVNQSFDDFALMQAAPINTNSQVQPQGTDAPAGSPIAAAESAAASTAQPAVGQPVPGNLSNQQSASSANSSESGKIDSIAAANQLVAQQAINTPPLSTTAVGPAIAQASTNRKPSRDANSAVSQTDSQPEAQSAAKVSTTLKSAAETAAAQLLAAAFSLPSNSTQSSTSISGSGPLQNADGSASSSATVQSKVSRVASTPNLTAALSSFVATTNSAATNTAAPGKPGIQPDASSVMSASQAASQPGQHPQSDSVQTTIVAARPVDGTVAQALAIPVHAAGADSPSTRDTAASASSAPLHSQESKNLAEQPDNVPVAGTPTINTAKLVQSMNESEMRLGMHSAEFGDISIRTSVSQQQVQAQINVDHTELGSAISAHIPSLEAKLGIDFGIHASVEVNQLGSSFHGGQGQSSQQGQHLFTSSVAATEIAPANGAEGLAFPAASFETNNGRLDIRA